MSLGPAVLKIIADISGFVGNLQKGAGAVKDFGVTVQRIGGQMQSIGIQATAMGAALSGALAPIIIQGAKFEQTMSKVRAVVNDLANDAGDASGQFAKLTDQAIALGSKTIFSATQVAEAMEALGQAGFTSKQIFDGVEATLSLAAAGALDLGQSAEIAADSMTTFGLAAGDINRVADVLAAVAAESTISVKDLAESLKYAAPLAAKLGFTIEETAAMIGLLGKAGIKASMAGTNINAMFTQMLKKSDKLNETLKPFHLTFADVDPSMNSAIDIINRFKDANISAEAAVKLFSTQGARALLSFTSQTKDVIANMFDKSQNSAGVAMDQARIRMANLLGTFDEFKSAIEGLNINIFYTIKSTLGEVLKFVTQIILNVSQWVKENQTLAATLTLILGGIAALGTAFGALTLALGSVLAVAGGVIAFIATGFAAITIKAVMLGTAIFTAVSVIAIPIINALMQHLDKLHAIFNRLVEIGGIFWGRIFKQFSDSLTNGQLQGALDRLTTMVGMLLDDFLAWLNSFSEEDIVSFANVVSNVLIVAIARLIDLIGIATNGLRLFFQVAAAGASAINPLFGTLGIIAGAGEGNGSGVADREKADQDKKARGIDLTAAENKNLEVNKASLWNIRSRIKADQELLQLQEKELNGAVLTVKEHERILALQKELGQDVADRTKSRDDLTSKIESKIRVLERKKGELQAAIKAEADPINGNKDQLEKNQRALNEVNARLATYKEGLIQINRNKERENELIQKNIDLLAKSKEARQKDIEAIAEEKKRIDEFEEAQGKLETLKSEMNDMERDAQKQGLDGLAAEIKSLQTKNEKYLETIKIIREVAAVNEKLYTIELNNLEKAKVEVTQLEQKLELLQKNLATDKEIKKAQEELTAAIQKKVNLEAKTPEQKLKENKEFLDAQEKNFKDATEGNDKKAAEKLQKREQKLKEFLLDQELDQAKHSKNNTRIAEIEAQKYVEVETRKLNELTELVGQNDEEIKRLKEKGLKNIEAEAGNIRQAGVDKDAEQKKKDLEQQRKKSKSDINKLEKEAEESLAKQVQSAYDLYMLYLAIDAHRMASENRAMRAAQKALQMQREAAMAEKKAAENPTDFNKSKADKLRGLADLQSALAGTKGDQAQLDARGVLDAAKKRQAGAGGIGLVETPEAIAERKAAEAAKLKETLKKHRDAVDEMRKKRLEREKNNAPQADDAMVAKLNELPLGQLNDESLKELNQLPVDEIKRRLAQLEKIMKEDKEHPKREANGNFGKEFQQMWDESKNIPAAPVGGVPAEGAGQAGQIAGQMIAQGVAAFAQAPFQWISAFVVNWQAASAGMIEAIKTTMAQVKAEMDPEKKHSPSLVDVWRMNIDTVKDGVNQMGNLLVSKAPNLHELNLASLVSPRPSLSGASSRGAGGVTDTRNLTDNRNVTINVNGKVDEENLKRHISKALGNGATQSGLM